MIKKGNAEKLRKQVIGEKNPRSLKLAGTLAKQFNELHALNYRDDFEIERQFLQQEIDALKIKAEKMDLPEGIVIFRPSSASKCPRELFFQAVKGLKDEQGMFPFQKRWVNNASAVHSRVQKDFLYMEKKLENPAFTIARTSDGLPAWEDTIKTAKIFKHKGQTFAVLGMMDGILDYNPEGIKVGFEFKTKSTTIAAVGEYKMKDAQDGHKTQCVAYSLIFGLTEFILMYESLAKDNWTAGNEAKSDIRTFYLNVTEKDRTELLDKFAAVVADVKKDKLPKGDTDKCFFCEYKDICGLGVK